MKHVLDVPWGSDELKDEFKLKGIKGGAMIYNGTLLPRDLRPFRSRDFSFNRWTEDESNAHVSTPVRGPLVVSTEGVVSENAEKLLDFYENDKSGVFAFDRYTNEEKAAVLFSTALISKNQGVKPWSESANKNKLLIVTGKGSMSSWRHVLKGLPVVTALTRPLIISYSQMNKLITAPANARIAAKRSTKSRAIAKGGKPTIAWDFIIFDHFHQLYSKMTPKSFIQEAIVLANLRKSYRKGKSPFIFFSSSRTTGSPLEYELLSEFLSVTLGSSESLTPDNWATFLKDQKFFVYIDRNKPIWLGEPPSRGIASRILNDQQVQMVKINDSKRISDALRNTPNVRSIKNKKRNHYLPLPIELSGGHQFAYAEIWADFRDWLNKNLMNSDPEGYAQRVARYFRRTDRLKEKYILELVMDILKDGDEQIYLKAPTIEAVEFYNNKIRIKKIVTASITAVNEDELEDAFTDFQDGVISTLIATDILQEEPTPLTINPLAIMTDPIMAQTFLNEQKQLFTKPLTIFLPFIVDTVEEKILKLFIDDNGGLIERMITPLDLEKKFRITAASTTPPNRMS